IPKSQKATLVVSSDAPIIAEELASGECLIKMHLPACGHTDLHAPKGDWPLPHKFPLIVGHEGVGEILAIGAHTINSLVRIDDRVGMKWLAVETCLQCELCRKGLEQSICAKAKLSRYTVDGTFSRYVVSYVAHVALRMNCCIVATANIDNHVYRVSLYTTR
ncbi:mannitol phosphate dehydrogenase-like protein cluster B, partial [Russula emetica]